MIDNYKDGMAAFRAGKYDEASELFAKVVEVDDDNPKAWNAYGITLSKLGNYADADTCYENALMLDPGNETYQKNRDALQKKTQNKANKQKIVIQPAYRPWWQYILIGIGGLFVLGFIAMVGMIILAAALSGASSSHSTQKTVNTIPASIPVITVSPTRDMVVQTAAETEFPTLVPTTIQTEAPTEPPTPEPTKLAPVKYEYSGPSSGSTDLFELKEGLAEIKFTMKGDGYNGMWFKDSTGDDLELVANQAKAVSGSKKVKVPADGSYYLDITGEDWSVVITQ